MSQYGSALAHFSSPLLYQRGRGLGGIIRGLFRSIRPLFKKPIVRKLGKVIAQSGIDAAQKALTDESFKSFIPAFKESSKTKVRSVLQGRGKRKAKHSPAAPKRKKRRDIFS